MLVDVSAQQKVGPVRTLGVKIAPREVLALAFVPVEHLQVP
jgi:hypothetical protein